MRLKNRWLGLALFMPALLTAQQAVIPLEKQRYFKSETCFQMWRIEGSQNAVTQLSFPLTLYVPFNDKISLTLTHVPAFAKWGAYKLNGISDTWVQGTYLSGGDKWMANLGLGVPTGKTRLNNEEMFFTQFILSQNMYGFRLPVYGQGFCLRAGGAYAYPLQQRAVLGIGAQYLIRSAYHPASYSYSFRSQNRELVKITDVKYKPGNELSLQAGLDCRFGENTKVMLDAIYTHYDRDLLEQNEIYRSGQKICVQSGFYHQYDEQFVWVYMNYRLKGKHELLRGLSFMQAERNLDGAQMDSGVLWKVVNFRQGQFYLLADGRFYGRNENKNAGATIYGGGFGFSVKLSAGAELNGRFKYLGGKLIDYDSVLDKDYSRRIENMELGAGLKIEI